MLVPKDCIEKFGKTEIVIALKTSDPLAAKAAAGRFKAFWADRFEKARESKPPVSYDIYDPTNSGAWRNAYD
jgi:hypothetical protein